MVINRFDKWGFLADIQMLALVMVLYSVMENSDGSFLGVMLSISGIGFILAVLYLRNYLDGGTNEHNNN